MTPSPLHPARYARRGVLLPVITPALVGCRLRLGHDGAPELLVPHAAGRSYYVLAARALHEFCTPALHDAVLVERLGRLDAVDPAAVRAVARRVVRTGVAGIEAARAAVKAEEEGRRRRLALELALAERIARAPPGERTRAPVPGRHDPLPARGSDGIARFIRELAQALGEFGFDSAPWDRSWPSLLPRTEALADQLASWRRVERGRAEEAAREVEEQARNVAAEAASVAARCRRALARSKALLHEGQERARLFGDLQELLWLLDGWPQIVASWERTVRDSRSEQRLAVLDMHRMLPPSILEEGLEEPVCETLPAGRRVRIQEDWQRQLVDQRRLRARERVLAELQA